MGFQWGGGNITGCDQYTCLFLPGWRCQQPGSAGYVDEIEGPIPIPGEGGRQYVDPLTGVPQGWGEVPQRSSFGCWCANAAGTFANQSTNCVAEQCPYPSRCLADNPRLPYANGTSCILGSEGLACVLCSQRWFRSRDTCQPCPTGVPVGIVLLAIGVGSASPAHVRRLLARQAHSRRAAERTARAAERALAVLGGHAGSLSLARLQNVFPKSGTDARLSFSCAQSFCSTWAPSCPS